MLSGRNTFQECETHTVKLWTTNLLDQYKLNNVFIFNDPIFLAYYTYVHYNYVYFIAKGKFKQVNLL